MTVAVASPATAYAEAVNAGDIVAGPLVRMACARHLRDLERVGTAGFPYRFDLAKEERFYRFAAMVNLSDGVRFELQDFQRFIVGSIFGWVDSYGHRRFRTAYVEMGKGNGKSPLAALAGLYGLTMDGEVQAEVYSAAVTRDQANIMFRDARNMAEASPYIKARLEVLEHNIAFGDSFFRTVSSEGRSLDGKRPHMTLLDEIHEHPNNIVLQKMRAGMKRRPQPLVFEITNSGSDRRTICWEHHEHSRNVVEGLTEDETWFAYVCGLDVGDDWTDELVWPKANPGLGTLILPVNYLREQVKEALSIPSSANLVKRLNFCIWTEQADRWLDMTQWDACGVMQVSTESLAGETCFIGLDLASRHDFTAAVFYFPEGQVVIPLFWVPEDMSGRTEQERQVIRNWADLGLVRLTEGNITDYDVVRADILREAEKYQVEELAYDTWNATQLATQLQIAGLDVVPMQQGGAAMSEAAKALAAMVAEGTLHHGGHPVLRYMASNVAVREDLQGNIRLDRDRSGDKIDGIAALTMAVARASLYEASGGWTVA